MILVGVAIASYGLVAHHLHRSGYGPGRILAAIPLLSVAATLVYGAVVAALGLHSEEAALDLIVVGFGVGAVAFTLILTLSVWASREGAAQLLARTGSYLVVGYVQAVVLLVGFLLLAVLGLG